MSTDTGINLQPEESGWVRLALLHGMAAVAELERLREEFDAAKECNRSLPDTMKPVRPDGLSSVLPNMISALHVITPASTIGGTP